MAFQVVQYRGANSNRLNSPNVWYACPISEIASGTTDGKHYFDDFLTYDSTATGVRNEHGLPTFEGTTAIRGTAATTLATGGGFVELFVTADNEEAALELGGAAQAPWYISNTAADSQKLWFECRVKDSLIDDVGNHFIGLAAPGSGVADFINDTGTDYADVSFIGFTRHEDDGDSWDFTYQATGNAFSNIATGIHIPVADTFVKLGFVYDPERSDANKIAIYVNGTEQSTYVTTALIDTATFPEGEGMGPMIATKASSAADRTLTVDWVRVAQLG